MDALIGDRSCFSLEVPSVGRAKFAVLFGAAARKGCTRLVGILAVFLPEGFSFAAYCFYFFSRSCSSYYYSITFYFV